MSRQKTKRKVLLGAACLLFLAAPLFLLGQLNPKNTVTLEWDQNPEPDIAGYKVYSGRASRDYSTSVDVGKVTVWKSGPLAVGPLYFAITAYNVAGIESGFSNEITSSSPSNPKGLRYKLQ